MAKYARNMNEIYKALDKTMYNLANMAGDKVKELIDSFIMLYYNNYTPKSNGYIRTYQFLESCIRSKVIKEGNGYYVMVYIDTANLDYEEATGEQVVDWANQGLHGGMDVGDNVRFWDESMDMLINKGYLVKLFSEYLKKNGLKVTITR